METLSVSRVKGVSLASCYQLLLVFDLIWVMTAGCTRNSNQILVNIKNEIMLSHQGAPDYHLTALLNVNSYAISTFTLPVQVFARVPIKIIVF